MTKDAYEGFAERYDWMKGKNTAREQFFLQQFEKYGIISARKASKGERELYEQG